MTKAPIARQCVICGKGFSVGGPGFGRGGVGALACSPEHILEFRRKRDRERMRKKRMTSPERVMALDVWLRLRGTEESKAMSREQKRKWKAQNAERLREQRREWRAQNAERLNEYARARYSDGHKRKYDKEERRERQKRERKLLRFAKEILKETGVEL